MFVGLIDVNNAYKILIGPQKWIFFVENNLFPPQRTKIYKNLINGQISKSYLPGLDFQVFFFSQKLLFSFNSDRDYMNYYCEKALRVRKK